MRGWANFTRWVRLLPTFLRSLLCTNKNPFTRNTRIVSIRREIGISNRYRQSNRCLIITLTDDIDKLSDVTGKTVYIRTIFPI